MGLEGKPYLAQMVEKVLIDAAGECQVRMSLSKRFHSLSGRDARADPSARNDHALGGKCLHRFAQYRPRDAETERQFRISGENAADRELARNDRLAELIHDLAWLVRFGVPDITVSSTLFNHSSPGKLLIVSVILAGDDQH